MNDTASNLGLGARISMLFAVGGLLVSLVLAAATLLLTRQQLLDTREQAAAAMAISNATRLSNQLTPDSTIEDLPTIADSLTRSEGSQRIIDAARPGSRPPNWTVTTCRLPSSN